LFQVHANDADANGDAEVWYKLAYEDLLFKVDYKTGVISTLMPLDREINHIYQV